jgi:hypothetical protein
MSDKKFFKKDYPDDKRPVVHNHFDHPYPKVQDDERYDKDYIKDENDDGGYWKAQMEYDRLKNKGAAEKEQMEKALEKSRKKYRELKQLRDQLQREKRYGIYVKKEQTRLESELVTDRYVKRALGQVLESLKLLLCLIAWPLLIPMTVLPLLMVGFVLLVMCVKELLAGLIRLCWAPFYLVQRKLQGK